MELTSDLDLQVDDLDDEAFFEPQANVDPPGCSNLCVCGCLRCDLSCGD